jgi:hypothetical protein
MAGKPAPAAAEAGRDAANHASHTLSGESTHQRRGGHEAGAAAAGGPVADADAQATLCKDADLKVVDDMEETIRGLPSWQSQLSLRGYIVGESGERAFPRPCAAG